MQLAYDQFGALEINVFLIKCRDILQGVYLY